MRAFLLGLVLGGCAALGLGPAEQAEIDKTAEQIAKCQSEGYACKADGGSNCYGVYDACMRDAGLR